MAPDIPKKISDAGLEKWYSSLPQDDAVRLSRYIGGADASSAYSFLSSVSNSALAEENHSFSVTVCEECLRMRLSDIQRFDITEMLIEAYIGVKRYDDAKRMCGSGLDIFPRVSEQIKKRNNGTLPEKIACRNRYIDIVVGIGSGYDEAFALLRRFLTMGMISQEEYAFRERSLKIHRLQRSFDGVYTYTYKE